MKVLITGAAGFVGGHLAEYLRAEHPQVESFGLVRPHGTAGASLPGRMALIEADLEDAAAVEAALDIVHPDRIVHLAAQSSPQDSWRDPAGTLRSNILGLAHLLEALRKRALLPRLLVIGSAEEYGAVEPALQPVREDAPLRPASPYAVSKVAQGYLALQYALTQRMGILLTRTFNHTGPGRGDNFAESSFARQIAEIEAGRRDPVIAVGNLETVRDFSDVRDVVRAYWLLLEKGEPGGVYNVCSGKGVRIREILERLVALAALEIEIRVDPERLRPADVPRLVGDPSRLRAATAWEPRIPLETTLRDLLQHWREAVSSRAAQAPQARSS